MKLQGRKFQSVCFVTKITAIYIYISIGVLCPYKFYFDGFDCIQTEREENSIEGILYAFDLHFSIVLAINN